MYGVTRFLCDEATRRPIMGISIDITMGEGEIASPASWWLDPEMTIAGSQDYVFDTPHVQFYLQTPGVYHIDYSFSNLTMREEYVLVGEITDTLPPDGNDGGEEGGGEEGGGEEGPQPDVNAYLYEPSIDYIAFVVPTGGES